MSAASVPTRTLARVLAIAAGLPAIGPTRAKAGYTRYAEDTNWEELLRALTPETQGYFSAWLSEVSGLCEDGVGGFAIAGELAVCLPKDQSSDLQAAWDLCLALAGEFCRSSLYLDGEAQPAELSFRLHRVLAVETGGIALFDFGAYGAGGLVFRGA